MQIHRRIVTLPMPAWKSFAVFGKVSIIGTLVVSGAAKEVFVKRKSIYLVFCVLGVALPYSQFVPWVIAQRSVPMGLFLRELFASRIGGFFGMDVLVSAVVLIFFFCREGKRLGIHHLWLPIAGPLTVGVSLGFPLFLYLREGALEERNAGK